MFSLCRTTVGEVSTVCRLVCRPLRHTHGQALQKEAITSGVVPSLLSAEEVESFHRDGYVKVDRGFLTDQEQKDVVAWSRDLHSWPETAGKWMQYFEQRDGKRMLCRVENFLQYHDGARHLVQGKVTKAISELMGEEAILYKEKVNFKLPGAQGFKAHQDAPAYVTFGMKFHITCLIAADPATEVNGCLEVVPGFQSLGMLPHPDGSLDKSVEACWDAEGRWKKVLCEPGDVVFFDSLIPHRSGPNRSKTMSRNIYYLTFNPLRDGNRRDEYFSTKRKNFPPDIERERGKDYSEGAKVFNVSNPIPVSAS